MKKKVEAQRKEQRFFSANIPEVKTALRQKILSPAAAGLIKEHKPQVLILTLDFDSGDSGGAAKYPAAKKMAEDKGYKVINRVAITYGVNSGELIEGLDIKQFDKSKPVTIWLTSHGALGWLFGAEPSFEIEEAGVKKFSSCLKEMEIEGGFTIDNILLNSCWSAAEFINDENNAYINSPARLLSLCMPEQKVLGYIGTFGDGYVKVHQKTGSNFKLYTNRDVLACSVVFQEGQALEFTPQTDLFCTQQSSYARYFVLDSCFIPMDSTTFFKLCPAREEIVERKKRALTHGEFGGYIEECYADEQLAAFESYANAPDRLPEI